jgi:BirA family biotin operon repressor/biotin-[acetyl-CoA-carboxylase] ligase
LRLLKEHRPAFVSGEAISRHLQVTRTAVWKRIQGLRSAGYKIEGSRRLGYRLIRSPDLLTPSEVTPLLQTAWLGRKIHYFEAIGSTNSEAYRLALHGAQEGEVVIADSQGEGKGRLGRRWFSPPHANLYLSVILRPKIPPHRASCLTLMAAVATAEAIETVSSIRPGIKWPNDILLEGKKVGGLLNEIHSEADRVHFVVLGIGVNVNTDINLFPEEIRGVATSLREEIGHPVSRKLFLQTLLEMLERWYEVFLREGGEPILRVWREWAQIEGKEVRVSSFGEIVVGKAVDVDSDGTLILDTGEGIFRRIVAGDLEYRE